MKVSSWLVEAVEKPMVLATREERPSAGEVIIAVAGCGLCHTDMGFYFEGIPTRHGFPLALGHEVAGTVVEAGEGAESWFGQSVIVPAVIPCGDCPACLRGRGRICPKQVFPGSDIHGGFGSHIKVPSKGLCKVPDLSDPKVNPLGLKLESLSVIADAVTTPYQAIDKAKIEDGDLAIFVGVGGVGGFGVQIAAARGAHVVALDTNNARLEMLAKHGASLCLNPAKLDFRALKKAIRGFAKELDIATWRWHIFETSGTAAGQTTAFGLMGQGSYLGIVGFTRDKVEVRLSNLMAFDAVVRGTWGCLPEHYPAALDLVLSGKVQLEPFIEYRSLDTINETFTELATQHSARRIIFCPES